MISSRRRFLKSGAPALLLAASATATANGQHVAEHEQQATPKDDKKFTPNACEFADVFVGTERRVLDVDRPTQAPVLGSIYGFAATIENASGTPLAIALLNSPDAGRRHYPALWAYTSRQENGPAQAEELAKKDEKGQATGASVWDLTGKVVWFDLPNLGARNIRADEVIHPWQPTDNVPLLNAIRPDVNAKPMSALEEPTISSAMVLLNRGRLETGVPWSFGGRNALYSWVSDADVKRPLPGRPTQMSDNQLWSFWLPEGQNKVDVMYRELGKPNSPPRRLVTLFRNNNEGIAFFLSNDLKPGVATDSPDVPDSIHYWRATSKPQTDLWPKVARSVSGRPDKIDPSAALNDCDTNCQRVRIRLDDGA